MRILFVNGHLNAGGVEKSLINLLKSLDYSKYEVDLLLFEGLGEYASQVPSNVNIKLFDLHSTYGSFIEVLRKALKKRDIKTILVKFILSLSSRCGVKYISLLKILHITNKTYDCAIAYRIGISAEYVGYVVRAKKKYIWWHHGEFNYPSELVLRWQKTLTKMNKIVCVSETARKLVELHFPKMLNNIVVIPNMIIAEDIKKQAEEFNPYYGIDKKVLVSVGRLSSEKHMINAVYAMENLLQKGHTNIVWYLVGDGFERSRIEEEIVKRKLQGKVICVGSKPNPYPYIKGADIFIHPSYVESQGLTVLEAFVLQKLCIVTKSDGIKEFVIDRKNAILTEQSVESLIDCLEQTLKNSGKIIFDEQFQKKTVEKYFPEVILEKVTKLIDFK